MFDNSLYARAIKAILDSLFRAIQSPLCDHLMAKGLTQMSSPLDLCKAVEEFDANKQLKQASPPSPVPSFDANDVSFATIESIELENPAHLTVDCPTMSVATPVIHSDEKITHCCISNDTVTYYMAPPQTVVMNEPLTSVSELSSALDECVETSPCEVSQNEVASESSRPLVLEERDFNTYRPLPGYVAKSMCNMLAECSCSSPDTLCSALHPSPIRDELLKLRSFRNFIFDSISCVDDGLAPFTCANCNRSFLHDRISVMKRGGLLNRRFRRKNWNVRPCFTIHHDCSYLPNDVNEDERLRRIRSYFINSVCVVPNVSCAKTVSRVAGFANYYVLGVRFDTG